MNAVPETQIHHVVIARVEQNLVDTVSVTVVGLQFRRVFVGEPPVLIGLCRRQFSAHRTYPTVGPTRPAAMQSLLQRRIGLVEIEVLKRRRLVGDFMRRQISARAEVGHGGAPVFWRRHCTTAWT